MGLAGFHVCKYFVSGTVHSTLEKSENAALFLRLNPPPTLIRRENGAFVKRSRNWRNLKTPALRFSAAENILKTEVFDDV